MRPVMKGNGCIYSSDLFLRHFFPISLLCSILTALLGPSACSLTSPTRPPHSCQHRFLEQSRRHLLLPNLPCSSWAAPDEAACCLGGQKCMCRPALGRGCAESALGAPAPTPGSSALVLPGMVPGEKLTLVARATLSHTEKPQSMRLIPSTFPHPCKSQYSR